MFTFGKRLTKAQNDIIAYDIVFKSNRFIKSLDKNIYVFTNLDGSIITPSVHYKTNVQKMRLNRHRMDKGLYLYKHGYKTFCEPRKQKDGIIVSVIIPAGAYFACNLFGQIISSEIIYPNKF